MKCPECKSKNITPYYGSDFNEQRIWVQCCDCEFIGNQTCFEEETE